MDPAGFDYIRVSQAEGASRLATQSRILNDHGLRDDRIFTDVASGRNMRRPTGRPPGTRGCNDDPSRGPRPVRRRCQRHGSGCGQRQCRPTPFGLTGCTGASRRTGRRPGVCWNYRHAPRTRPPSSPAWPKPGPACRPSSWRCSRPHWAIAYKLRAPPNMAHTVMVNTAARE